MPIEEPANTSGQGKDALVPSEIRKWNWGAFVFINFWVRLNLGHSRLYLEEGAPFWNVFSFANPFFLGAHGNEIAWKYRRWPGVDQFLQAQRWWTGAAVVVLIAVVVFAGTIVAISFTPR